MEPKKLYKLARNKLFHKIYICTDYSIMIDDFLLKNLIKLFICNKCESLIEKSEILRHKHHYCH